MRINIQPIEKAIDDDGSALYVHSVFHTIQGEGPLTGHPAIFIRLGGCNLQCPQCDTEYTDNTVYQSVEALMMRVRILHPGPRLVVITGGEPFRQNISPLCMLLLDEDYQVQVETNGTLPPPFGFPAGNMLDPGVLVVVSPKAAKVHPRTAGIAVAWKYVLNFDSVNPEDGLPIRALDHTCGPKGIARPPEDFPVGAVYLQPADLKDHDLNEQNLQGVIRSCMRHGYTLQLQTHKLINME